VIYAHLSLHYFDRQTTKKIFEHIHKALKKEGCFFIKVKHMDDSLSGRGRKIEEDMFECEGQIRHFFSRKFMLENLQKFNVIKIRKTSSVQKRLKGTAYKASFLEAFASK
jgi:hypothetical protein